MWWFEGECVFGSNFETMREEKEKNIQFSGGNHTNISLLQSAKIIVTSIYEQFGNVVVEYNG